MIQSGDIDTVVVAFPDLQGRPVGKRVTGAFFLEHVPHHGIEACDYLLACDVDMEPLPGYRFANWETGYGDLNAVIDPQTVRPLPWLPGSALVLCDLLTLDGRAGRGVAPAHPAPPDRAGGRPRARWSSAPPSSSSTSSSTPSPRPPDKRWQDLTPHADTIEDYQLLQTSREEYIIGRIRNRDDRGRDPHRVLQG